MRHRLAFFAASLLWPAAAVGQAQDPGLSAGGLAPPPAVEAQGGEENVAPNETQADLERSDREDSGRGLEFVWLNGEVGIAHFGLQAVTDDGLVETDAPSKQTGVILGAGLGIRFVFLTAGVRFRYAPFEKWKLWTLGAEGGLHLQLGALEPYLKVGLGYASIPKFQPDVATGAGSGELSAGGFDARLGLGLDYYLTNMFSVGLNVSGDLLVLSRSAVAGAGTPGGLPAIYASDGSSIGAGVTATAVGGLHF